MAHIDIIKKHIPDDVKDDANSKMAEVRAMLAPYFENLTEEQTQKYGSIDEQNKLFVNKVLDYHTNQPTMDSPDVDWTEYTADYSDRVFLENLAIQSKGLETSCIETKRCHDYDNYQDGLTDKKYTDYKADTGGGSGYDTKSEEYAKFFKKG